MEKIKNEIVKWTRDYLNSFGGNTKAIIGISGGKDSSIAAAICVEAVGRNRVVGVMMPQHNQHDQDKAKELIDFLKIKSFDVNIGKVCDTLAEELKNKTGLEPLKNSVYYSNTPARIRMATLYGIAALLGDSRVVNTCNRSEDYVGYSTKFGDSAGDFSPLSNLTVREVKLLGYELGLPKDLIEKAPEDGLSGKTDEDNLGFTYNELDDYLLNNVVCDKNKIEKIEKMHRNNLHKLLPMPSFEKSK